MTFLERNIFDGKWDAMVHVCNLYHTMGAGIAKQVALRFPEAVDADLRTQHADKSKLGSCSVGILQDNRRIYNLYAQKRIGNDGSVLGRNLSYDALNDSLFKALTDLDLHVQDESLRLAIPSGLGCGLAGGDWTIVLGILRSMEEKFDKIIFTIYKL